MGWIVQALTSQDDDEISQLLDVSLPLPYLPTHLPTYLHTYIIVTAAGHGLGRHGLHA